MYACVRSTLISYEYFICRTEFPWQIRAAEIRTSLADQLGLGSQLEKKQQEVRENIALRAFRACVCLILFFFFPLSTLFLLQKLQLKDLRTSLKLKDKELADLSEFLLGFIFTILL